MLQILSAISHLLGVAILTHILSYRLSHGAHITKASWPRICTLLFYADSWLYIFITGVLTLGAGLDISPTNCTFGIWLCVVLFMFANGFMLLFLLERVHIVWRRFPEQSRLHSKVYIASFAIAAPALLGIVILICVVGGPVTLFENGVCKMGFSPIATIAILALEASLNFALTGLFAWPLMNTTLDPWLRRLGIRSLCATTIGMAVTCINLAVFVSMNGLEVGWVCFSSCVTDLAVNSIVLFWVTDPISEKPQDVGTGITDNFPHFAPFDEAESTVALPAATINKTCYDGWRPTGQQTLHELQIHVSKQVKYTHDVDKDSPIHRAQSTSTVQSKVQWS